MAKYTVENMKLGKHPRRTDQITEESDDDGDKAIIADLLQWMQVDAKGATPLKKDKDEKDVVEMIEAGLTLSGLDKVSAISSLQSSPIKSHIKTGLTGLLYDIYYGAKDLLSKQRVKTTLTILAGIGIGVAIGAVLGTIVFPGIGTAAGGAIGGLITSGLAAVGGAVGLSIIGGVIGSWLGNRVSKKLFKEERHYELSKRVTSKIKSDFGIQHKTTHRMSAYLYNRRMAVKSPLCQRYYRMLRKNAIKQADPIAFEKLGYYFCNELKLLDLELQADPSNVALLEDRRVVLLILRDLKGSKKLPTVMTKYIEQTLKTRQEEKRADSVVPPARMEVNSRNRAATAPAAVASPILPSSKVKSGMEQVNQRFVNNLREAKQLGKLDIKAVDAEQHRPDSKNHSYYLYHISRPNKPDLPDIMYREVKINANQYSAEVLVDKSKLDEENENDVSEVLVAQAKAIYQSSGNRHLKVIADKDDVLAVRLMAAALKADMIPELDEREYPLDTPQATDKRKVMLEQAYALAGIQQPVEPKARVGFRVEFEP